MIGGVIAGQTPPSEELCESSPISFNSWSSQVHIADLAVRRAVGGFLPLHAAPAVPMVPVVPVQKVHLVTCVRVKTRWV